MPPAARHAAGSKNRPIQLVGFGDVVIAAGVDEVLTTSTPGKPILGEVLRNRRAGEDRGVERKSVGRSRLHTVAVGVTAE